MRRHRAAAVLPPVLAAVLWAAAGAAAPPGTGDPAADVRCDPQVAEALAESARRGVEADLAVIRHPEQGIRNPDSILDFSCIGNLFDYRAFDILFDPRGSLDDVLDLARRRICAAARDAYRRWLGRGLDPSLYTVPARRLPGLDTGRPGRDAYGGIGTGGADGRMFRDVVEGGR